jgi:acyl-coenzyme A synthetase/AMP-(fatty) acid ligase
MGDVGYLDDVGRLWYCGRQAHRVETKSGVLFSVPVEEVFNAHPAVHRTALVGVGPRGAETPVLVVEPAGATNRATRRGTLAAKLITELRAIGERNDVTRGIMDLCVHSSLPTDVRHNAKIAREEIKSMLERQRPTRNGMPVDSSN